MQPLETSHHEIPSWIAKNNDTMENTIKEQKIYNGKYAHYKDIFPLETQTGKTNIFYIHSSHTLFTIQYTYRIPYHPKP